jgi:hypothetical protein
MTSPLIHQHLRLFSSEEQYIIEPSFLDPNILSESLVISRDSGLIRKNVPALPSSFETHMSIYGILGILKLFSTEYLILITERAKVGSLLGDVWKVGKIEMLPIIRSYQNSQVTETETFLLEAVNKVLHNDFLYFSYSQDLTRPLQSQSSSSSRSLYQKCDRRFFWNYSLQRKFIDISERYPDQNLSSFILPVVSGFVRIEICKIYSKSFSFALISRRSPGRSGTRYFSRGVDHSGNVSNFVETEQILMIEDSIFSHVQIRGSIPLFWMQVADMQYLPPLKMFELSSEPFRKHFDDLKSVYGDIIAFNLVNKKGSELLLGEEYSRLIKDYDSNLKYAYWDFHSECKNFQFHKIRVLLNQFKGDLESQKYFWMQNNSVKQKQTSVFRTNCIDCLDRTNVFQSEIGYAVLTEQFRQGSILSDKDTIDECKEFHSLFKNIWADNADALSLQYSGTHALKTDFTRTGKRSVSGAIQDLVNSCLRYIINNLLDGPRQDAFDLLLGKFNASQFGNTSLSSNKKSFKIFLIGGCLVISFLMSLFSLVYKIDAWSFVFWGLIFLTCFKLTLFFGNEFVVKPMLIDPYLHPSPLKTTNSLISNKIDMREKNY